jgi:hypothetical protein
VASVDVLSFVERHGAFGLDAGRLSRDGVVREVAGRDAGSIGRIE